MIEYTYQQKIAMMRILLDLVNADGVIDEREIFLFNKFKENFELVDDDKQYIDEKNSLIALSQINEFDDNQKIEFCKYMSEMIVVDNDININEVAIFDIVCKACGIKQTIESFLSQDILDKYTRS